MRRVLLFIVVLTLAAGASIVAFQMVRDRDYRALLVRGDAALRGDQVVPAIEAYSGAATLRPDSMLPRLRRGEAYQRRGDFDAAIRDFRDAANLDAAATRPREDLGDALYQLQRYQRAANATSVNSDTLTLFGRALLRDGQVERAEQVLQVATSRYPVDPMSFAYYATAAERQKHLDAARQALIDLVALQGDDENLVERSTRIASLSMRLNDPAAGARWYQKAVDAGGTDARLLKALADAQAKAGLQLPGPPASDR